MHLRNTGVILAGLLFATSTALAEPDAAATAKARDIGLKGLALYDEGNYSGALAQFEQAYAMYRAPTLGLYSARALAKLGRLVEASRRYLEVSQAALPSDAPEPFRQAKADAQAERVALIQRIPRLRVEIAGASETATRVTVDDVAVEASELAAGRSLNPGAHVVRGERGGEQVTMNVALQEGETRTVTLEFKQGAAPVAVLPPGPGSAPSAGPGPGARPAEAPLGTPRDTGPASRDPGAGRRTFGWVVLGLGGVGVGIGAITGAMAAGKKSDLEKVCPDLGHCPEAERANVDQYMNLRTASTIGFVAGGIGVAGGALLLLTAPKPTQAAAPARLSPWIGIGSAGMRGRF